MLRKKTTTENNKEKRVSLVESKTVKTRLQQQQGPVGRFRMQREAKTEKKKKRDKEKLPRFAQ